MVSAVDGVADKQQDAIAKEMQFRRASERVVLDLLKVDNMGLVSKGTLCKMVYMMFADNDKLTRELFKLAPNSERFANITPEHRALLEGENNG